MTGTLKIEHAQGNRSTAIRIASKRTITTLEFNRPWQQPEQGRACEQEPSCLQSPYRMSNANTKVAMEAWNAEMKTVEYGTIGKITIRHEDKRLAFPESVLRKASNNLETSTIWEAMR